jgi:hypothetical protein
MDEFRFTQVNSLFYFKKNYNNVVLKSFLEKLTKISHFNLVNQVIAK